MKIPPSLRRLSFSRVPLLRSRVGVAAGALLALTPLGFAVLPVFAQEGATPERPAQINPPEAPAGYWDTLKLSGHIDFGFTANPNPGRDGINFGHLFTDRANAVLLNQLMLTAERPIDPKATGNDFGFKFQVMYGSDARITHFLNEFARDISGINQVDIVEANLTGHFTTIAPETSVDVKIGQYPSPLGAEVIDAAGNPFYSHSYIFNFGVPYKHTGGLITTHANETLDIYLGGDTGVNTALFRGDNNGVPAFLGGFGLNLMEGNLTILALTHIGPELPVNTPGLHANGDLRFINDVVITYKPSDKLTLTTDINYLQDNRLPNSNGVPGSKSWGIAQYASYALRDDLALVGRFELFDDISGNIVGSFVGNRDFVNSEIGAPLNPRSRTSGRHTLYSELTLGVNWKPEVPETFKGLVVRPEIRFDKALTDTRPFQGRLLPGGGTVGRSDFQMTAAIDVVIPF